MKNELKENVSSLDFKGIFIRRVRHARHRRLVGLIREAYHLIHFAKSNYSNGFWQCVQFVIAFRYLCPIYQCLMLWAHIFFGVTLITLLNFFHNTIKVSLKFKHKQYLLLAVEVVLFRSMKGYPINPFTCFKAVIPNLLSLNFCFDVLVSKKDMDCFWSHLPYNYCRISTFSPCLDGKSKVMVTKSRLVCSLTQVQGLILSRLLSALKIFLQLARKFWILNYFL